MYQIVDIRERGRCSQYCLNLHHGKTCFKVNWDISGEATLQFSFCPFSIGINSYRKEFAPVGANSVLREWIPPGLLERLQHSGKQIKVVPLYLILE